MSLPYLTRLDTGEHVANSPAGVLAKRVVASNLDHLANSHGQVLVNWGAADGNGVERDIEGASLLWESHRFPLRLRSDGSHFPLRVRLRGRLVTGSSCRFSVRLVVAGVPSSSVVAFDTASTTGAWLTAVDGEFMITNTAESTASIVNNIAAPLTLGGSTVAYPEAMGQIVVRMSGVTGETSELTGVYVAEFVGA